MARLSHCATNFWRPVTDVTLDTIRADFALLEDWEDRYRYLIELGRSLHPLPESLRIEANKVRGCASQVWLACAEKRTDADVPVLTFEGDSDAHIVRGLIAILFAIYQEKPAEEILAVDAQEIFAELELREHLTPQRSNGFAAMVERMKADARRMVRASAPAE
jgi:cysteine desulfuration protein SufE